MQSLIDALSALPLELFVVVGSFLEELISPIPSVLVLTPAGASVNAQNIHVWYLLILSVLAAAARIPAALILYWLSGKLRTYLFSPRGSWVGVHKADVTAFQKRLHGHGGWWAVFAAWAIPVFPGAVISLGCGLLGLRLPIFITATFIGSIVSALFYLSVGYYGLHALMIMQTFEVLGQVCGALAILAVAVWLMRRRAKKKKNGPVGGGRS